MAYDPLLGFDPELGLEPQYQNPYQGQQGALAPKGVDYTELIKTIGKKYVQKQAKEYAAGQLGSTTASSGAGDLAAAEAANASWNAGAGEASQAAWNAGATAASEGAGTTAATGGTPVTMGATPAYVPAAAALATALAGRSGLRMLQGKQKNWKDASATDNAGRAILAMGTFGFSELANKLLGGRKSTKQIQRGHTKALSKMSDDATWQNYLGGMRNQETNSDAPFAGKYRNFDEYKKAGLEAGDLTGVYGNLKTFGPDWSKMSFEDQKKVTQGIIDAGLYDSKKGEVRITDAERAKQILAEAIKKK